MRYLATQPCMAPQLQANSPPLKKCHLYTRGQVDFKNVIPMLRGKHKKKCFLRSMGSTFSIFSTPPQPNCHFFLGKITAEGCQKWQIVIPTLREKQKKISFLRSMGSRFFTFVTPLDWYSHFWLDSPGSGRLWPALAGSLPVLGLGGSGFSPTTRAGGQDYVSYTQTPSN